ncbi:MAG: Gfo/Idh/MocA family oxidoreductase [Desulfamplus sp.]|nr:Gfo/Idh/MocA family oxidoreductase [Desulfamplus sp.]
MNSYNFALIGAAGYVAPKHLKAIRDTKNRLIAAIDKSDSVGILDSFAYDVSFFTEFERFDRHAEKLRRLTDEKRIHFVSICSPNYLHDAHIRFALRIGADAICEKPLVLNPWNLDALSELERETGKKVYNILQLRCHPSIIAIKEKMDKMAESSVKPTKKHDIILSYITSRGNWYMTSWKGVMEKSGGIATNIGIHFFDMLFWIFGKAQRSELHLSESRKMGGFIELERATVRWFLSIDRDDLPQEAIKKGAPTYRSITVDGEEIEFSGGFTDLHTIVYQDILDGKGYGIEDARASIELVSNLRNMRADRTNATALHPFMEKLI